MCWGVSIPIFQRFLSLTALWAEGGGGGIGHTFGVRVDGASPRGLWPLDGGRLCRRVVKGKVLKMDGPSAQGFLSLTGPSAPRVVDCPSGNAYEVSVTGFTFSVI